MVGLDRRRAQDHHREARLQAGRDDDRRRPDEARPSTARRWPGGLPRLARDHVERARRRRSSSTTRAVGAVGKTPLLGRTSSPASTRSGSRAEGYDEYKETIDVAPGETARGQGDAEGLAGRLARRRRPRASRTRTICSTVRSLCERGPCLKSVPEGTHTIEVTRPGYKPYTQADRDPGRRPRRASRSIAGTEAGPRRRDRRRTCSRRCSPAAASTSACRRANLHERAQEGDRRRHAAPRLQRSALPARQDLLDRRRRCVRDRRHHRC